MIGSDGSGGRVCAADGEIAITLNGGPGLAAVPSIQNRLTGGWLG